MTAPTYHYAERAPSASLRPWVLSLWSFRVDTDAEVGGSYSVWPDGCTSVALLQLPGATSRIVCVGPRSSASTPTLWSGMRLSGVRLWPDAVEPALGVSAELLRGFQGPAIAPIAQRFDALRDRLSAPMAAEASLQALDSWLVEWMPTRPEPDPRLRRSVEAIISAGGEATLEALTEAAALSARQLQRLFRRATGLTMREFSRVRRLREALAQRLRETPPHWSRVAAETGFVDHAHLTKEFGALTGLSPTRAAQQLARTGHHAVRP